nr:GNAT family N-acetyltransferase [uncultured Acetatifactor sp.]
MEEIRYELVDNVLSAEDFVRLKMAAGFIERPLPQVEKALKNGLFNVSAICDGQVVGMGRLVGDGAMYWYLQEIVVLPEYQGKGIGKSIVNRLLEHIRSAAMSGTIIDIGLTAVKGKEPFYEKFGFSVRSTGMGQLMEIQE